MDVQLLGPVRMVADRQPIDLGGSRPTRVLIALFSASNRRLTTAELIERCFDDGARLDAAPALRTAVRRLRRALGDSAITTHRGAGGGYELAIEGLSTDIERFEEFIAAGRATNDPVAAQTRFHQALELWRGSPFGDLGDLDWLVPERIRLSELHLVALEGWHDAHLRNGSATEIVPSLEAVAAEYPLRERFQRQLMHALYLADRQSDALRVFQNFRSDMIGAGLEPSDETIALERQIATSDTSLRSSRGSRRVRDYQIEERLGEGAFSIVYRGRQASVDRPVAIKQIRAELANRPEFIRRFETEAHLIARLEHPFIVPLYDYWREPGSAYLIMRFLRGGSLGTRLHDGRWDLDKTLAMVHQVGDALATAHRAGVVHRDVKPANILLDQEHNAYLADFGIALAASEAGDPAAALSAGSPAYASPEQLQRLPVGPPADVHGLAIATYEALTGQLPFPDEPNKAAMVQRQLHDPIPRIGNRRPELPSGVDAVFARATAKSPTDRYQTVEAFVAALDEAAAGTGERGITSGPARRTMVAAEERNPYKGLRAFDEADAGDFTGRERLVDQLVDSLHESRLVAVVGSSGSGKSSVVRAGLLPAIHQGRIPGSSQWFTTTLMPGAHPYEELETALIRIAVEHPPDLFNVLTSGERGIARGVRNAAPGDDAQVMLVIDQFEELFTLAPPEEAAAFLDALASAVTEDRSRLRVVLTLRADFYDRPLRHEAVGRLVRDATVAILPLAPDELEQAIVDPAHAVGADFEPGLVAEIAADVADQPGALPLLQYALTELYEVRQSGLMTRDAYRKLGGVAGALARRAEGVFTASNPAEQMAVRRLFGRLVSLGDGTEDTRRRALRTELSDDTETTAVIEHYGAARLLSFDRDPVTREPTIEVAHEALLREWPQLGAWLDEDRDGLRVVRHLNTTAQEWEAAGRPDGELYRGGRLEAAEELAEASPAELRPLEREFVDASVARREAETAAEQRTNQRLRRLVVGVGVVAALALIAGVFAFIQRSRAQSNADAAQEERFAADTGNLAAEAAARGATDPQLALLLAAEAHRRDPGPASLGLLQRVMTKTGPYLGVLGAGRSYHEVEWLVDGRIVGMGPSGVSVFNPDGRLSIDVTTPVADTVFFVGDGTVQTTTLAAAGTATVAYVADGARNQLVLLDTSTASATTIDTATEITAVEADRDGSVIYALESSGALRAYDANGGAVKWSSEAHPEKLGSDLDGLDLTGHITISGQTGPFADPDTLLAQPLDRRPPKLALSADGMTLVSAAHIVVRRWDPSSGTQLGDSTYTYARTDQGRLTLAPVDELAVSPDGSAFAHIWRHVVFSYDFASDETASGAAVETSAGFYARPKPDDLDWGQDGAVWTVLTDGRIAPINVSTGRFTSTPLTVPFDGVRAVDVDATAATAVVASDEGVAVIALDGDGLLAEAVPRLGRATASLQTETQLIALSGAQMPTFDRTSNLLYDISGDSPVALEHPALTDLGTFFSRDETRLLSMTANYELALWGEGNDREIVFDLPGSWVAHYFSPDGRYLAFSNHLGIQVVEADTGAQVVALDDLGIYPNSVAFSADSTRLAGATLTGATAVWEVDSIETVDGTQRWRRIDQGQLDGTTSLEYSVDGRWLATVDIRGVVHLRDPVTAAVRAMLPAELEYSGQHIFAFGDDGDRLVLTGRDHVELWDIPSEQRIGDAFPNDPDFWAVGSDGPQIATGVGEWAIIWNLDTSSWLETACRAAGRNFTPTEWEQFGPSGTDYQITCPEWPAGTDDAQVSAIAQADVDRSLSQTQIDSED